MPPSIPFLTTDSTRWNCTYLCTVTTFVREYKALAKLHHNRHLKRILIPNQDLNRLVPVPEVQNENFRYLEKYYNEYQIKAIQQSVSYRGFHLIQGPFPFLSFSFFSFFFPFKIWNFHRSTWNWKN